MRAKVAPQARPLDLISTQETAQRLGLLEVTANPKRAVLEMARRGELVGVMVGRWKMIRPESVDAWIRGHPLDAKVKG